MRVSDFDSAARGQSAVVGSQCSFNSPIKNNLAAGGEKGASGACLWVFADCMCSVNHIISDGHDNDRGDPMIE